MGPHLQYTPQNTAAGDASLQIVHLAARLVDVEGPDDDESRGRGEVSHRHRDLLGDVLTKHFNVVLELSRDWHYWSTLCHRSYKTNTISELRRSNSKIIAIMEV